MSFSRRASSSSLSTLALAVAVIVAVAAALTATAARCSSMSSLVLHSFSVVISSGSRSDSISSSESRPPRLRRTFLVDPAISSNSVLPPAPLREAPPPHCPRRRLRTMESMERAPIAAPRSVTSGSTTKTTIKSAALSTMCSLCRAARSLVYASARQTSESVFLHATHHPCAVAPALWLGG